MAKEPNLTDAEILRVANTMLPSSSYDDQAVLEFCRNLIQVSDTKRFEHREPDIRAEDSIRWFTRPNSDDVLCSELATQDQIRIEIGQNEFPIRGWKVAQLMNYAFRVGMAAKQGQLRKVLGM